jgi:hypothetical protein
MVVPAHVAVTMFPHQRVFPLVAGSSKSASREPWAHVFCVGVNVDVKVLDGDCVPVGVLVNVNVLVNVGV